MDQHHHHLVHDALGYRWPMQILQYRRDAVKFLCSGHQTHRCILDGLQSLNTLNTDAEQQAADDTQQCRCVSLRVFYGPHNAGLRGSCHAFQSNSNVMAPQPRNVPQSRTYYTTTVPAINICIAARVLHFCSCTVSPFLSIKNIVNTYWDSGLRNL